MVGTVSFFVLLSVSCCKGTLYMSTGNSTWSGYNNGCIPATPKVKVGTDKNYYVDESLGLDLPFNDKVWVGYYQVVRVFEYIGCVSMESILNNKLHAFVEINGDPGHCFPGCGDHTIVGVTKTKCYCLSSDITLTDPTQTDCRHECKHPIVSCGYDSTVMNYAFLSIYKMNPSVTASAIRNAQNEGHNCLALNPVAPKSFYWEKCTHFLVPMCANVKYIFNHFINYSLFLLLYTNCCINTTCLQRLFSL
ncbi:uncharacterized protein LOC132732205 [Ruditapes philippinarum]|uniref:uncharacterized protein LOC132732205 n=1 Tax=Ruditapes philippinarum TaxID=129788 RepID=UPI00295B07C6|nr:uncharacterized protein LOC132732205 [Ruditapes philippinarum]